MELVISNLDSVSDWLCIVQ